MAATWFAEGLLFVKDMVLNGAANVARPSVHLIADDVELTPDFGWADFTECDFAGYAPLDTTVDSISPTYSAGVVSQEVGYEPSPEPFGPFRWEGAAGGGDNSTARGYVVTLVREGPTTVAAWGEMFAEPVDMSTDAGSISFGLLTTYRRHT